MSKVKGPLFSVDASGSIGDAFFFSKWKSRKKVSKHFVPKNPKTAFQQLNRSFLAQGIQSWRTLSPSEKQSYQDTVDSRNLQMSGYNFYLSEYVSIQRNYFSNILSDDIVIHYSFDSLEGGQVKNLISDNWHLNPINNADLVAGKILDAGQSNKDTKYWRMNDLFGVSGYSEWSFMFWIWINPLDDWSSTICGADPSVFVVYKGLPPTFRIRRYKASGAPSDSASYDLTYGTWHHIACCWAPSGGFIYLDGVLQGNLHGPDGQYVATDFVCFGTATPGGPGSLDGKHDDFLFYGRQLAQWEVQHNMNRSLFFQ